MALIDDKVKVLPGARRALGTSLATAALDALLITGQTLGLSLALTALWQGAELTSQMGTIALFLACWCLRQLAGHLRSAYLDRFARTAANRLQQQALEALYAAGPSCVQEEGRGATVTTLVEGTEKVKTYLALILPKVADLMVVPALLAIVLLVLDPVSGIIALVMIPCIIFYMRMMGSYARESAARQHGAFRRLANHFVDSLRGMRTLALFGRSKQQAEAVFDSSEELRQATMKTLKSATLNSLVLELFRVFALAAIAILLGFRLMAGTLELMSALAVLILVPEFFGAVRRYATDFHASLDGSNQLQALLDLVALPPEGGQASLSPASEELPDAVSASTPAPAQRSLVLQDICFAYGETETLHHLDLDLTAPLKVGIVGASGAGKSTLARLLAGFSSPTSGTFLVDGTVQGTLAQDAWRRRVTYIPQKPHIFNASLRDNLAFYQPQATDGDILKAAAQAGLDQLLEELPQGLDTLIGEGGRGLSEGQAHRVALARSFLDSSRDVLVFDEPTAHLDIETELALKEAMLPLMEGRLVFFATHRLHWMQDMDLVLVLDQGRIVESGSLEGGGSHDPS